MSLPTWISKYHIPFSQYLFPPTPFYRSSEDRARRWSAPQPAASSSAALPASSASDLSAQQTSPPSSSSHSSSSPRFLSGHTSYLRCARCSTDLCLTSQIISKGFTGRHGRAYLVCPRTDSSSSDWPANADRNAASSSTNAASRSSPPSLPNTTTHKAVPRQLVTGAHTVSDISCAKCGAVLGWKYIYAEDEAQRYKVGKFILETKKVCVAHCWEEPPKEEEGAPNCELSGQQESNGSLRDTGRAKARNGIGGSRAGIPSDGGINGNVNNDSGASTNGVATGRARITEREKEKDRGGGGGGGEIQFDSQDEEECDDLFAGVWSPALATRRRSRRRFGRGE